MPPRIYQLPCFVIHRRDYRNSSLFLELFSEHEGRFPAIAKGAKRQKNNISTLLQPFTPLQINLTGRGEIKNIGQVERDAKMPMLSGEALYCGFYLNELLMRLLHRGDAHAALYLHYVKTISLLSRQTRVDQCLRSFEKVLLKEIGYELLLDRTADSDNPINPEKIYTYVAEHGPVSETIEQGARVHGRTLLYLHEDADMDRASAQEAKSLMRYVLAHYLGEKPLKSRELFQGFRSI